VFADEHAARALPGLLAALGAARCRPLEGGEELKQLGRIGELLRWLSETGAERGDPVVAFGGGTVGDAAGFVAAVYLRGVPFVQVPTTWLAQVDSALGGKVGVNLPGAKNAVGAFWPPVAVIADVAALRHLPRSAAKDGMVESLKAALIGDPALWTLIEERGEAALGEDEAARYAIVERAARVKLTIADRDPTETGERRQLNLGHTLGHALEVESSFRLPHGEAVALGLRAVANLAAMRGAERGLAERIEALLDALAFPRHRTFQAEAVRRALLTDKKRSRGRLRWLLPVEVGRVQEVDDVSEHEVDGMLRHVSAP
jgi:3-dehydroquinate synthetase